MRCLLPCRVSVLVSYRKKATYKVISLLPLVVIVMGQVERRSYYFYCDFTITGLVPKIKKLIISIG